MSDSEQIQMDNSGPPEKTENIENNEPDVPETNPDQNPQEQTNNTSNNNDPPQNNNENTQQVNIDTTESHSFHNHFRDDSFDRIFDEEETSSYDQDNQSNAEQDMANDVLRIKLLGSPMKQELEYSDSEDIPTANEANMKAISQALIEILLWKRSLIMIIVILFSELLFGCIYFMDLDSLSTLVALLITVHTSLLIFTLLPNCVKRWIFPPLNQSQEESIASRFFKEIKDNAQKSIEWGRNYIIHPNAIDTLLFIGTSLLLFTIFLVIGSFWAFVIGVHALYIYPAMKFNSKLRNFVGNQFEVAYNVVNPKEKIE